MREHSTFIAVSVFVSLHSQALSIVMFNKLNFLDWCEQVQFHLVFWILIGHSKLRVQLLLLILVAITEVFP